MESQSVENHLSIRITRFYMRIVGMWSGEEERDRMISNLALAYTLCTMLIALVVIVVDFYYSWGDLHAITYNAPCTITVIQELVKLLIFVFHRQKVLKFNAFTENTFWKRKYELADLLILKDCNKQAVRMNVILAVNMQVIAWLYLSVAMVESAGKMDSERVLPFRLWFNLPFTETPYYEIAFTLETAGCLSVSICATTFASFLFTVCIYATGQFRILQRRMETSCEVFTKNPTNDFEFEKMDECQRASYTDLTDCIKQHQLLIKYMDEVEDVYCYIMMEAALGAVLQICFSGFQILLGAEESVMRTARSIVFFWGSVLLLYLFSWACHEISQESTAIAEAIYRASWYALPYRNQWGKAYRVASQLIVIRARKPCVLTVGRCAPMSLETFTSVFSTSISYFSVLRQMNDDMN